MIFEIITSLSLAAIFGLIADLYTEIEELKTKIKK